MHYYLMGKMRLPFIDSDLLYRGAHLRLYLHCTFNIFSNSLKCKLYPINKLTKLFKEYQHFNKCYTLAHQLSSNFPHSNRTYFLA